MRCSASKGQFLSPAAQRHGSLRQPSRYPRPLHRRAAGACPLTSVSTFDATRALHDLLTGRSGRAARATSVPSSPHDPPTPWGPGLTRSVDSHRTRYGPVSHQQPKVRT